jgi:hypothetical protein
MKRGTMRVRAEVVNLHAWGDGSVERRATENGRYRKWLGETVEPGRIVRRFCAGAKLATGTVAVK